MHLISAFVTILGVMWILHFHSLLLIKSHLLSFLLFFSSSFCFKFYVRVSVLPEYSILLSVLLPLLLSLRHSVPHSVQCILYCTLAMLCCCMLSFSLFHECQSTMSNVASCLTERFLDSENRIIPRVEIKVIDVP